MFPIEFNGFNVKVRSGRHRDGHEGLHEPGPIESAQIYNRKQARNTMEKKYLEANIKYANWIEENKFGEYQELCKVLNNLLSFFRMLCSCEFEDIQNTAVSERAYKKKYFFA